MNSRSSTFTSYVDFVPILNMSCAIKAITSLEHGCPAKKKVSCIMFYMLCRSLHCTVFRGCTTSMCWHYLRVYHCTHDHFMMFKPSHLTPIDPRSVHENMPRRRQQHATDWIRSPLAITPKAACAMIMLGAPLLLILIYIRMSVISIPR